jgi:GWxTD domain-containing protein
MKKIAFLILLLLGFTVKLLPAQGIGAFLSHATFNAPGQTPYVEVYLEIIGNTLVYNKLPNGQFQGSINVKMIISQDSVIKDFKKYDLLSAEVADTSGVGVNFVDQQRFSLPNGNYTLELSISDNNVNKEPNVLNYPFAIEFPEKKISISTIQLINSFTKSTEAGIISKSGYDLIPLVDNFFSSNKNKVTFYAEIYNPLHQNDSPEKYLISTYIESFETNQPVNEFASIKREESKPVIVILNEFDISKLPSGNYNLILSLKDKNNVEIVKGSTFFQRANPSMDSQALDYASIDVKNSFTNQIVSADTLREFVKSLHPIATEMEKLFINYQAKNAPLATLQQFFHKFWETRSPFNPKEGWEVYKQEVRKVNEAYSTQVKQGYDTDMGYVYLKYGAPNAIQDIPFETSSIDGEPSIPYQIWQYYTLNTGERNKRFVFINSEVGAKDYTLVHSDVKGEIQNYNWPSQLKRRLGVREADADMMKRDRSRAGTRYNDPY